MIDRQAIEQKIRDAVASSENTLKLIDKRAFDMPIIGVGSGSDELLDYFKRDIGEFYTLPDKWLEKKYKKRFDRAGLSIVSWALPQTQSTKEANRAETERPSFPWALNRTYGEAFQRNMAKQLEDWLDENGIEAIAPMASADFKWYTSEKYGYASNWSERHTAYMCGLGTFGLCDGLITRLGKAVRFGSVIFAYSLEPDKRPYSRYNEYCLADKGCQCCINRCPAHAISSESGHDKDKCADYQQKYIVPWFKEHYDFHGMDGCGLCQTGVPCEHGIPKRV